MKFQRDDKKVKEFTGGYINRTDFYSCTITKAYEAKSEKTLSESIHFEVVTDTGAIGRFNIWVVGKEGTPVERAEAQINDLMVLLDLDNLQSKPGKVKVYDSDLKQDVEQRKMVFPDLIDQQIGIVFAMRPNTYNGKTTNRPEFVGFYNAETMQSAGEFVKDSEAKRYLNDISFWSGDSSIIKQAVNQPTSPQNSAPVDPIDFNDDIPF
jgi:hypothetical protein